MEETPSSYSRMAAGDQGRSEDEGGGEESLPTKVPHAVCNAVFKHLHQEIRDQLCFDRMYPLLNSRGLLKSSENHAVLSNAQVDTCKKIDMLIVGLRRNGVSDYLHPFVFCLRESAAEAGVAHTELACAIEKQCLVELKRHKYTITLKAALIFLFILCVVATVGLGVTLGVWWFLPKLPDSGKVSIQVSGGAVISLDGSVKDRWWLDSVRLGFEVKKAGSTCTGRSAVVKADNCSSLPVSGIQFNENGVYVVKGSVYNITINSDINPNRHLWFIRTLNASLRLVKQFDSNSVSRERYVCHKNYSDAVCFSLEGRPVGSSVIYKVDRDDFYTLLVSNSSDTGYPSFPTQGLNPEGSRLLAYNLSAIESDFTLLYPWANVNEQRAAEVKMTEPFNFGKGNCALLSYSCSRRDSILTISEFSKRWDIPLLATVSYGAFLLVLVCVALVAHFSCTCCACCKLHRKLDDQVYANVQVI